MMSAAMAIALSCHRTMLCFIRFLLKCRQRIKFTKKRDHRLSTAKFRNKSSLFACQICLQRKAVAEILNEAGIAHYTGADSFVAAGAFTTCGVNYTELGTKAGQMALAILGGGQIGDFVVMDGGIITVNTETAEMLKLDYSVFKEMANTLISVTTSAE